MGNLWWYICKSRKFPLPLHHQTKTIQIMAISDYKISRDFKVGEVVYIPEYGSQLPLENGTATQFTIVAINAGNTDRSTELIVTCKHGSETLKLAVKANLAYKVAPSLVCVHCGHEVCFEADKEMLAKYPYYCPECDENLYGVEVQLN